MTTMAAAHHFMEQGGKKSNHKPGYVKRGVLNLSKCSALVIIGKQKKKKKNNSQLAGSHFPIFTGGSGLSSHQHKGV